jgi:hypothetical protein
LAFFAKPTLNIPYSQRKNKNTHSAWQRVYSANPANTHTLGIFAGEQPKAVNILHLHSGRSNTKLQNLEIALWAKNLICPLAIGQFFSIFIQIMALMLKLSLGSEWRR